MHAIFLNPGMSSHKTAPFRYVINGRQVEMEAHHKEHGAKEVYVVDGHFRQPLMDYVHGSAQNVDVMQTPLQSIPKEARISFEARHIDSKIEAMELACLEANLRQRKAEEILAKALPPPPALTAFPNQLQVPVAATRMTLGAWSTPSAPVLLEMFGHPRPTSAEAMLGQLACSSKMPMQAGCLVEQVPGRADRMSNASSSNRSRLPSTQMPHHSVQPDFLPPPPQAQDFDDPPPFSANARHTNGCLSSMLAKRLQRRSSSQVTFTSDDAGHRHPQTRCLSSPPVEDQDRQRELGNIAASPSEGQCHSTPLRPGKEQRDREALSPSDSGSRQLMHKNDHSGLHGMRRSKRSSPRH